MDTNDSYNDPYLNYYQTPKRSNNVQVNEKKKPNDKRQVFNPYKKEEPVQSNGKEENKQDDLPDYVDLTKNAYAAKNKSQNAGNLDEEEEIPLLEELGICPENIKKKLISVLTFHKIDKQILEDADMAGPFFVFILFALSLVLQTKTHFEYLYGLSLFGSVMMCSLMNLMSNKESILLYSTISVLGYCMLPVVILSFISIFLTMKSILGSIFSIVSILLSSYSATKFFEIVLSMKEQKWLIFYPVVLFYTCFVLLTIF